MRIMTMTALAALALAFTLGTASAAEKFTALDGVSAEPMTAKEMAATTGQGHLGSVTIPDGGRLFDLDKTLNLPITTGILLTGDTVLLTGSPGGGGSD